MGSAASSSEITRAVRRLLARPSGAGRSQAPVIGPVARSAVMGGIALLTLAPGAATAVGLGEAQPSSALGEPLRATVPMRLATGEAIRPGCVTTPARAGSDLRSPAGTRVRTPQATGPALLELEVTSRQPLYEPLYELTLQVDCPGLPKIMRHYVLMLDLPGLSLPAGNSLAVAGPSQGTTGAGPRDNAPPRSAARRAASLAATRDPIPAGQSYRVREGDTLSTIAARVAGRAPNTTWQLADRIFEANSRAFIRGNPDLIKLGYEITIPVPGPLAATKTVPAAVEPATPPVAAPAAEPAARETGAEAGIEAAQQTQREPQAATTLTLDADDGAQSAADSISTSTDTVDLSQDIVLPPASTSPFADESVTSKPQAATADTVEAPPPVALAPRASSQVNPLLAVLLGLLLGLGLSIVLLRSRLLEGLSRLFARGRAEPAVTQDEHAYADTDEWLKTEEGLHAEAFALGSPAEQTYIVEMDEAEASAAVTGDTPVVDRTADFDSPFAPPDSEYRPEFDDMDTAEASGAAEQPETTASPGITQTAEMPRMAHANTVESIDPSDTAETVAMPEADFDPTVEPEMAELFADDLSDLPGEPDLPVEIFAGADEDTDSGTLAPTADMPSFEDTRELDDATMGVPNTGLEGLAADTDETEEMDLQGLGDDQQDDSQLSDTLQEALSLLERDFNEELTASQIVDQSALKRAIADKESGEDSEDMNLQDPPRKRAG